MRQVSLLPAGCQPWNLDVCAASSNGDRFAYCATLAVYVYEVRECMTVTIGMTGGTILNIVELYAP